MDVVPGYEPLAEVFQTALNQSQKGKGKERHANDKPFLQQPIAMIGRMVGVGYNVGQAMKKGQESMRLPDDRAQAELLGAMVYLASAYLLIGERMEAEKRAAVEEAVPVNSLAGAVKHSVMQHTTQRPLPEIFVGEDAAHKAPSLCDSEVEKEPYTFPPALKFIGALPTDYMSKIREELNEAATAKEPKDVIVELFDVIHAAETAVRSLSKDWNVDAGDMRDHCEAKNRARGYYER